MGCEPRPLSPIRPVPRHDVTGTRRLQICLVRIAGDNRAFRSIYGFDTRPVQLDRGGLQWLVLTSQLGSAGVPRRATDANINTVTPNSTEIGGPGAAATNSQRRRKRDRNAHNPERRDIDQIGRDYWQFAGRGRHGDRDRRRAPAGRMSERLVVGGLGTGTLTIQNGGT